MTVKVALVTTARSEYAGTYWLLHDLTGDPRFETALIVGGSHLSARHGMTVREIEADGWAIAKRLPFLGEGDGDPHQAAAAALAGAGLVLGELRPDVLILNGDRYELLPIATAAVLARTAIAHLAGGDVTEGAFDEQVRHAVTKMAHLHFPSTALSGERVRQMGEEPWRVHVVGDPGLDAFLRGPRASADDLARELGFMPDRATLLVTFHPVTVGGSTASHEAAQLVAALRRHDGPIVITGPSPDPGADAIRREVESLARSRPRTVFRESLGGPRYRGLMHLAGAMVGNSSSALIEAPSVALPAVNVGERQSGRERAGNVIDAPPQPDAIAAAIREALSPRFRERIAGMANPYGDGQASGRVIEALAALPDPGRLLRKRFHADHSPGLPAA
jgi:UDP-hydrolysing UDP-N-acetyl-D-glucosamine 2-epimerase